MFITVIAIFVIAVTISSTIGSPDGAWSSLNSCTMTKVILTTMVYQMEVHTKNITYTVQ